MELIGVDDQARLMIMHKNGVSQIKVYEQPILFLYDFISLQFEFWYC